MLQKDMHFAGAGERGLEYWFGTENMDSSFFITRRINTAGILSYFVKDVKAIGVTYVDPYHFFS